MNQLFYEGQEVTPINDDWKIFGKATTHGPLPKMGEIYHVDAYGYHDNFPGRWMIRLKELDQNDWFFQECFAPVLPGDAFAMLIEETLPQEVGAPI